MKTFRRNRNSTSLAPRIKIYQCCCVICRHKPYELRKWVMRNPYGYGSTIGLKDTFADCIALIPAPTKK